MPIVTVWSSPDAVKLHQLSDAPEDGTPEDQIAHLATLAPFAGFECVSSNFTGSVPDTDPSLWRWAHGAIGSLTPPPAAPTVEKVGEVLKELGMTQAQLDGLLAAAAAR